MDTSTEELFFEEVKEDRGNYFVEYRPPIPSYRFATLQLVFPLEATERVIVQAMEKELKLWIIRYPIPIMVLAFDGKGDLYNLKSIRACNHLIGYYDKNIKEIRSFWTLLKDEEMPDDALNLNFLKEVYSDIPYKTSQVLKTQNKKRRKQLYIGWLIVFGWAVIVPAILAFLEWASPDWVQALILIYSLLKALEKALELTNKSKKSQKRIKQEKEEARMRHHHYHCEQNPEGFLRLKLENFERWEREKIQQEAAELKARK